MSNTGNNQANDLGSLFQEIKADLISYINNRITYYRLDFLERVSKSASLLALGLIVAFLAFSAFCFALMALAYFLGELLNSTAAGFGVVALFWIVVLLLVLLFREPIKKYFLHRTVRQLYKMEKEADLDEKE